MRTIILWAMLFAVCAMITFAFAQSDVQLSPAQDRLTEGTLPIAVSQRIPAVGIPFNSRQLTIEPRGYNFARSLDEFSCDREWAILDTTQSTRILFIPPFRLALKLTSGDCPSCSASEKFRADSLSLRLWRDDGSEADTMDLRLSFYCTDAPGDFCSGTGALRCSFETYIAFERDTEDTIAYSARSTISLGDCLIDSAGAILVIEPLGWRGLSRAPELYLDNSGANPVTTCSAWIGEPSLLEWADYFADPDPGYPIITAFITCDLPESVQVATCPASCDVSRLGGTISSFDTQTDAVYQWISEAQGASFPLSPIELRFPIYFPTLGSAQDVAHYTMSLGCLGFGDPCCPPGEELCSQAFAVPRGTPFQTIVDVTLDVSGLGCCIGEPFWFGLRLDSMSVGAPNPSFLFSTVDQDSSPPQACEQWSGHAGFLQSYRTDNLAWASMSLHTSCGNCLSGDVTNCGNVNYGGLECTSALSLACVDTGWTLVNQILPTGSGDAQRYCCSDLELPGKEKIYRVEVPNGGTLALAMLDITGAPLRLMVLESCDLPACIASTADSLVLTDLRNGNYFVVIDSPTETAALFDLRVQCFSECVAVECLPDLRGTGGTGNRYYDGEGDDSGDAFYYSYYSGSGTQQTILKFDALTCEEHSPVVWNSTEASASRMLAYDPRNGGKFWCGTIIDYFAGTGKFYRVNSLGAVEQTWNALSGLPIMRWSGAAFDPNHNHLWVMIRDSANIGQSRAYEIDLNNSGNPVVIQGPHLLTNLSPHSAISSGGADYARYINHLLVAFQGLPSDFVHCYEDVNPAYAGPRPGPGLTPLSWCAPDSNGIQGFGLALVDDSLDAREEMLMTNFTDSDWQHPMNRYEPPCRLMPPRCEAPQDLTIAQTSGNMVLHWTTPFSGTYELYSSIDPLNDGNPDGGTDPAFHREATLSLISGPNQWTDSSQTVTFKVYIVAAVCSTAAAPTHINNR